MIGPGAVSDVGVAVGTDDGCDLKCDILGLKGPCSGNSLTTPSRLAPAPGEGTRWEKGSSVTSRLSLAVYERVAKPPQSSE